MTGQLPNTLGPYRVEKVIATGGMGTVYLAHDERLGRRVAIKHVRPDRELAADARARLRREARAGAALAHPAIVQVFDILEVEEEDWVVMELIDGPTLARLNQQGSLSVARIVEIAHDVAQGLAYAHGQGIVHRDLKSENVILSHLGQAKILDFGLAKNLAYEDGATLTGEGSLLGTCRSMSPEQAQGFKVDARSDLFSFGVLLYESLSGISPFAEASDAVTLARVCQYQPRPVHQLNPEVPPELSDLIVRLLEKLPERRPSNTSLVAEELARLAQRLDSKNKNKISASSAVTVSHKVTVSYGEDETIDGHSTLSLPSAPTIAELSSQASDAPARPGLIQRHLAALLVLATLLAVVIMISLSSGLHPGASPVELSQSGFHSLNRHDRAGQIDQAIAAFEQALAENADFALAHAGLARAYWRKYASENEDPLWLERGRRAAERGIELAPGLAESHISLGLIHRELGHHETAIAAFEQALLLDPGNADAHRGLGDVFQSQGKSEAAETSYQRAIALAPAAWELHSQLGSLYFSLTRHQEAEASFLRVLELTPDNFMAHRNLSVVYGTLGRFDQAVEQSRAALEIKPSHSIHSNLGTFLFWQGRYSEAATAYEKAVELGANKQIYWANLADAYRQIPGRKHAAAAAYLRAIQLLREELAESPGDGRRRSQLAVNLARRGDLEEASAEVEIVADLASQDPATRFRCALAYELTGQRQKALDSLERALKAGHPLDLVKNELDLIELRRDVRYHQLLLELEGVGVSDPVSE